MIVEKKMKEDSQMFLGFSWIWFSNYFILKVEYVKLKIDTKICV